MQAKPKEYFVPSIGANGITSSILKHHIAFLFLQNVQIGFEEYLFVFLF